MFVVLIRIAMQCPLSLPSGEVEVREVIRSLTARNLTTPVIHNQLSEVYGNVISIQFARKWMRLFKEGREDVRDIPLSGRLTTAVNDDSIAAVRELLEDDCRYTVREMRALLNENYCINVSVATIIEILNILGLTKVSACWVPRELTPEHQKNRLGAALEFLAEYENDPTILQCVVTGDESWVHHYIPSMKIDSKMWHEKGTPSPTKFKTTPSAGKIMLTIFWDHKGPILIEFMEKGTTITSNSYCETLKNLRKAIKNKRLGLL